MFLCQLPTPSVTMPRYANLDMPATNKVYQTTGYANVHWHLKSILLFGKTLTNLDSLSKLV